jgi:hypothetical protein
MSRISLLKRSIRTAIVGLLFVGLVSPANATYQHEPAEIFPDLPASASADPASAVPTSHLPWRHRQPHRADVPQHEAVSARERQQRQFDQELDRKPMICRGC